MANFFYTAFYLKKELILLKTHFDQIFLFPVFNRTVSIFQQNSFHFSTEQFQFFNRIVKLSNWDFQQNCQIVKLRFQQICVNNFQQNSFWKFSPTNRAVGWWIFFFVFVFGGSVEIVQQLRDRVCRDGQVARPGRSCQVDRARMSEPGRLGHVGRAGTSKPGRSSWHEPGRSIELARARQEPEFY